MLHDFRGVPVSTQSESALEASNDFNRRLLRLDTGTEKIFAAQEAEPDDPVLNLYTALACLYAQTDAYTVKAGGYLDRVSAQQDGLSPRDSLLLEALTAFQRRQFYLAQERLEELTEDFPRDLLGAKVCEFIYYVLGQHYSGPRFREHMERLAPANAGDPDFLGMYAFACELSDDLKQGEALAREAIGIEPRNPWAHHALSHALIRGGHTHEGIQEMEDFLPLLNTCERLIISHNGWHLALLYLEQLDEANARRVFSETVWPHTPDMVSEQIDAIAFGWRMEMAGFPMGDFWRDVSSHATERAGEAFMPFLSAHYAYAFAKAGRDELLAELLETSSARAEQDEPVARHVWAPVGRNLIEAAAACGAGHAHEAAAFLRPVIESVACVGGSDAQDDLFRMAYIHSLQEAGQPNEATSFLRHWQLHKQHPTPLDALLAGAN